MQLAYGVMGLAAATAAGSFVSIGDSLSEPLQGNTEAEQQQTVGGSQQGATGATPNQCFGSHVVQLIAYPQSQMAQSYLEHISPHAPNGVYFFRNRNGHYVVRANAANEHEARSLLGQLRAAGVPSDAFVRTRSGDDPCAGGSAQPDGLGGFAIAGGGAGNVIDKVVDTASHAVGFAPPTRIVPSAQAAAGGGRGEFGQFSDADLRAALHGLRMRIAQMESGNVRFTPETRGELSRILAMDAAFRAELQGRGQDPGGPLVLSVELQVGVAVVEQAYRHLGKPYIRPETGRNMGPEGFDCSGLTAVAYRDGAGIWMNDYSRDQLNAFASPQHRKPGDIVGRYPSSSRSGHVAIYVGAGQYIHAPSPGRHVSFGGDWGSMPHTVRPSMGLSSVPPNAQIHAATLSGGQHSDGVKWFSTMARNAGAI